MPALEDLEAEQVVVAAGEQRAAQGRHDGEVVGGVVDGPQRHQQVAHRPGDVDEAAGLGPVGDAGSFERVLEERQRRAGRDEHGDVAELRLAPAGVGWTHRPTLQPSAWMRAMVAATWRASAARSSPARAFGRAPRGR